MPTGRDPCAHTSVAAQITFAGSGQTLSGRAPKPKPEPKKDNTKVKTSRRLDGKEVIEIDEDE